MRSSVLALIVVALGGASASATLACECDRLLATWPPAARTQVTRDDDSGTNGRAWRSRPLVNGGPGARYTGNPGADAYGAWGEEDQWVNVRVGQTVVLIRPWNRFTLDGMQTFERARQQWLSENGYTGGVRTFRNSAHEATYEDQAIAAGDRAAPEPRATIRIPEGARRKPGFHVDSQRGNEARIRVAALRTGDAPVRISWPDSAPVAARALSDATGGYLMPARPATVAQREP